VNASENSLNEKLVIVRIPETLDREQALKIKAALESQLSDWRGIKVLVSPFDAQVHDGSLQNAIYELCARIGEQSSQIANLVDINQQLLAYMAQLDTGTEPSLGQSLDGD
jgi:hypothetical protein